jgi:GntR family transcriptional regulator
MSTQAIEEWDRDARPSQRVRDHVLGLISGLAPHEKLPTERELAEALDVSRVTVRRVMSALTAENVVYRIQGSGTFVRPHRITKAMELTSFSEDMRSRGLVPGSVGIEVNEEAADAELAAILELTPGTAVMSIRRVRTADGERMCLERCELPASVAPGLTADDLQTSLYEVLHERYGITIDRAETSVSATVADPDDAAQLGIPPYSPVFKVSRIAVDHRGRPVEHAVSLYRGDRYSYEFTVEVARQRPLGS